MRPLYNIKGKVINKYCILILFLVLLIFFFQQYLFRLPYSYKVTSFSHNSNNHLLIFITTNPRTLGWFCLHVDTMPGYFKIHRLHSSGYSPAETTATCYTQLPAVQKPWPNIASLAGNITTMWHHPLLMG